ncbi:MAG: retron St85 family effector protein [Loktanella sp.]|nr:retron St85 family effector protein [Loktanella sp.]
MSLRVHAPTAIVFLCGGALEEGSKPPSGFRDLYFRLHPKSTTSYRIILAEEAHPLEESAGYGDLLSFESDIAQVVALIVLFVESAGSLAELGAFAALETVAPSLLAILTDHHYAQSSFIMNGPIRFLERRHGEESVLALDSEELKISPNDISVIEQVAFQATIEKAIEERLNRLDKWSKFDPNNAGHIIMAITGLCQEFGALIEKEIREFSSYFGVNDIRFTNYVYCAELLGWIKKVRKGNHIYYVAVDAEQAINFKFIEGVKSRDKARWRSNIRIYWQETDSPRMRAIQQVNSGS